MARRRRAAAGADPAAHGLEHRRRPPGRPRCSPASSDERFYFVHSYAVARAGTCVTADRDPRAAGHLGRARRRPVRRGRRERSADRHPVPPREVRRRRACACSELARWRGPTATVADCDAGPALPELLPAVDVADGQAVRLVQGESGTETAYGAPLARGPALGRSRARSGSTSSTSTRRSAAGRNRELLAEVIGRLDVEVELSGGIRDDESLAAALATGCRRVNLGTAALEDPEWCAAAIAEHGDQIAVGLDVRGTTLAARGWTQEGGDLWETLARLDADGLRPLRRHRRHQGRHARGPNLDLLRDVCAATDRPVVASGGVPSSRTSPRSRRWSPTASRARSSARRCYAGPFTLEDALAARPGATDDACAVRVIPCLDVDAGRVVKGVNFQGLRDAGDPVELARAYDAAGADELTFLDITASHEGRATTFDVVSRTAEQVFIPLTVGGGVSSVDDVDRLLRAGADKVASTPPPSTGPRWSPRSPTGSGSRCWCSRSTPAGPPAPTRASRSPRTAAGSPPASTRSRGPRAARSSARARSCSTRWTPTAREDGFDLDLIRAVRGAVSIPVIASGGAGRTEHFAPAVDAGADAVLAASVFHFGTLPVGEVKAALAAAGHPVRCSDPGGC